MIWKGIALLAYGAVIVASLDNLLKPKLIGQKAGIHPVFILIGALGGMLVFGAMGFLIGPVILALLITFINIYEKKLYAKNGKNKKKAKKA